MIPSGALICRVGRYSTGCGGALLVVGWFVTLLRWRRFPYDWQRAAITLLIFTPLVMILPTALATNELIPSNLRAIGLIPFIFYLPAIGVVILFRGIERRFGYPPLTFSVIFIALLSLALRCFIHSGYLFRGLGPGNHPVLRIGR